MEDEEEGVEITKDKIWCIYTGDVIYRCWHNKKGQPHRLTGPAVIYNDGDMTWFRHGKYHRDDGPARIWPSTGLEEWYKDDVRYEPSAHDLILWKMKKKE